MRGEFYRLVAKAFQEREDIFLLLGDIGAWPLRNTLKDFPDRALNLGIAEQSMISIAAGLAREGFMPVVHSIAPFITTRALEQIKIGLAYQGLRAIITSVGAPFSYSKLGSTHHCPEDFAQVSTIPSLNILAPADNQGLETCLGFAFDSPASSYIRISESCDLKPQPIQSSPSRMTHLLSLGKASHHAFIVVGSVQAEIVEFLIGSSSSVFETSIVRPLEQDWVSKTAPHCSSFTIVESASEGSTVLANPGVFDQFVVQSIGFTHDFIHGNWSQEEITSRAGLSTERIKSRSIYDSRY